MEKLAFNLKFIPNPNFYVDCFTPELLTSIKPIESNSFSPLKRIFFFNSAYSSTGVVTSSNFISSNSSNVSL